jgi:hypothetical protein
MTNTLAFCGTEFITGVKSFIVHAQCSMKECDPKVRTSHNLIKLFTSVIYERLQ